LEVLTRIKTALADIIVEAPNEQQFQVSFSAGVTEANQADEAYYDIYRRADNALLLAKQFERNRIERG